MTTAPARQAGPDRAGYLREVCDLLWPPPAAAAITSGGAPRRPAGQADSQMIVLPGAARPRLVVPAGRRASAAAVRRYGEPGSARARLAARVLWAGLASGAGGALLRDRLTVHAPAGAPTIESYLRSALGRPVLVSVHLGAPRANRKPVLQLLAPGGETIGFAKLGVSPLTAGLVRAERAALGRLDAAGLARLQVPRVLHSGSWRDIEVLVLSPLPTWSRRARLRPGQLDAAMAEVAGAAGVRQAPLGESGYWQRLTARFDAADAEVAGARDTGEREDLRAGLAALAAAHAGTVLDFGAWHGDWTPWNMASTRGGLLVWDWERFASDVPVGFDALHYWLQARAADTSRDPRAEAMQCVSRAPELLGPLGVPPSQARATVLAYLADLSVRYLSDRQEQAGARLGAPRRWLLPALQAGLAGRPATPR